MKFEEFCLKLLSFPWIAKLSGWKHHCTEYTQTPFPIITLPGGTFYPTSSSASTSPFTFAPTVTTSNPQATTTATIATTVSEKELTTTGIISERTTKVIILTTTEQVTESTKNIELTTQKVTDPPIVLTTTVESTQKITEVPPILTTTLPMIIFPIIPPILTTTVSEILTTTDSVDQTSRKPPILTTTDSSFPDTTLKPPILTTTDNSTPDTTLKPPILTTTDNSIPNTTIVNNPVLTTTSESLPMVTTEDLLTPSLTTIQMTTIKSINPPILTTTEEGPTTKFQTMSTSSKSTTLSSIPSSMISSSLSPPVLTTTSQISTIPVDPVLTTTENSFTINPEPPILTTTEFVASTTQKSESTTSSTSILKSSTIPSTIRTTITDVPSTIPVNPNTCPPFPTICNPGNNDGNFGDNSIDPRLVRNKRQTVNGCPCIDIRSALNLLISKGMLGEIPQNKLKNVKNKLSSVLVKIGSRITQNCLSPDGAAGYCINFRKCNFIVNLIIQLQQKQDDGILNYLKKSICGQDGQDPMKLQSTFEKIQRNKFSLNAFGKMTVCCPALVFASLGGPYTNSPQTSASPGAIVFGPVSTQRTTFNSSLSTSFFPPPSSATPQPSPPSSSGSGSLVFGPVTNQNSGSPTTSSPISTVPGPILNTLPTNDVNKCGMTYALKSRIVGGQAAVPGSYPWLAALGYNITNSTTKISIIQFLCGGTLITQRHILSAAHCIISTLISARLGAYDITQTPDGYNTIDSNVIAPYVHELYNPQKITYDISVIKLDKILPITNYIRPACIPLTDAVKYKDFTGNFGWVAGWGSTSFGGPASAILQEVQLPVVALADCAFNYKLYFPNQVFDNNILCAGYPQGGKDSCQGDSGGGFVVQQLSSDGTYYYYNVIGIVSYGYECARPGFPGIYTRVTQYIPWIQSKIIL